MSPRYANELFVIGGRNKGEESLLIRQHKWVHVIQPALIKLLQTDSMSRVAHITAKSTLYQYLCIYMFIYSDAFIQIHLQIRNATTPVN